MKESVELLKELSMAFGPSGYENEVVDVIEKELRDICETKRLNSGSLLAVKKGNGEGKIMVSTHIDEVGFVISKIENGYGRLVPIGGVDPKILPSQLIKIKTREGFQSGVVGMLAPHLQKKEEKKDVDFNSIFVDLSCAPAAQVGDVATVNIESERMGEEYFHGKALDDRASAVALILAIEELSKVKEHADLYALFSSQEEIGMLGASTGTFGVKPDIGIAVDVTFADNDLAYAPKIEIGKGPAIAIGPVIHKKSYDLAVKIAKQYDIPYQIEPNPGRTGTDADAIQLAYKGVPVLLFSIPEFYMHTPVEVISLKDMKWTARLLSTFAMEWSGIDVH